jgi:hypothetical protein
MGRNSKKKDEIQSAMFVWFGGPLPPHVIGKISVLKARGYDVRLLYDPLSTPDNMANSANEQLEKAKAVGCSLMTLERANFFNELKRVGLTNSQIAILRRAYLYQLHGHDIVGDGKKYTDKARQNFAAASDIARLIGLIKLQKEAKSSVKVVTYLDHDVMPNENMGATPGVDFQVHQLGMPSSVVAPIVANSTKEPLALNNAMIRLKRESDFAVQCLHMAAERYQHFFELSPTLQASLSTNSRKGNNHHRLATTFFLAGPHLFESLHHQGKVRFTKDSFLHDQQYNQKGNCSNVPTNFENDDAQTWLKIHTVTSMVYQENDNQVERDLMFMLGQVCATLLESTRLDPLKIPTIYKRVMEDLSKTGLPEFDLNLMEPTMSNHHLISSFNSMSDFNKLADAVMAVDKNNPLLLLRELMIDKPKAFKCLKLMHNLDQSNDLSVSFEELAALTEPEKKLMLYFLVGIENVPLDTVCKLSNTLCHNTLKTFLPNFLPLLLSNMMAVDLCLHIYSSNADQDTKSMVESLLPSYIHISTLGDLNKCIKLAGRHASNDDKAVAYLKLMGIERFINDKLLATIKKNGVDILKNRILLAAIGDKKVPLAEAVINSIVSEYDASLTYPNLSDLSGKNTKQWIADIKWAIEFVCDKNSPLYTRLLTSTIDSVLKNVRKGCVANNAALYNFISQIASAGEMYELARSRPAFKMMLEDAKTCCKKESDGSGANQIDTLLQQLNSYRRAAGMFGRTAPSDKTKNPIIALASHRPPRGS